MMTIKDVTSVEHLPTFTRFVFDLVYPKERESSQASLSGDQDQPATRRLKEKEEEKKNKTSKTDPVT